MRLVLLGDGSKAGRFIGFAKKKMNELKRHMERHGHRSEAQTYNPSDGVTVVVKSNYGWDKAVINAVPGEAFVLIICIPGPGTQIYETKRYFFLEGGSLREVEETQKPQGIAEIDDGKYAPYTNPVTYGIDTFYDDPDDLLYRYNGNGVGVGDVVNGKAAKDGSQIRYILNGSMENEIPKGWHFTVVFYGIHTYLYHFYQLEDSLILNPLKIKSKPFVSRYVSDGILTIPHKWYAIAFDVYLLACYLSDNFHDTMAVTKTIYHKSIKKNEAGIYPRKSKNIEGDGVSAAACNFYSDSRQSQDIVRANTFDWSTSKMAEPLIHETYTFDSFETKESYYRSMGPDGTYCSQIDNDYKKVNWEDGNTISCKTLDESSFTTRSGLDTIANDIKIIYSIDENNNLTYVRFQKDTEFTQCNTGIWLAGELVEESGWEPVDKLLGDTETTITETHGCPIYRRKTVYKILHSHEGLNFKAVLYRKNVSAGYDTSELLDYRGYRTSGIDDFVQIRRSYFDSTTTFHLAVRKNGGGFSIVTLPYKCDAREYQLTGLSTPYSGPDIPIVTHLSQFAYCDVADNNNSNITRIYSDETYTKFIIGFDVFPVKFSHILVREQIGTSGEYALVGKYDDSEFEDVSSDRNYPDVKDRKWFVFNADGSYTELDPPKDINGNHVKRINGLGMFERVD